MPEFMHARARLWTRNPLRLAGACCNFAVQRRRQLQMNERPPGGHEVQILFIQFPRFARQQADGHLNARGTQMRKTFAGHFWIWIFNRRYDSTDAGIYQGVSARRRAAMMGMRLKR